MNSKQAARAAIYMAGILAAACSVAAPPLAMPPTSTHPQTATKQVIVMFRAGYAPSQLETMGLTLTCVEKFSLGNEVRVFQLPSEADTNGVVASLAKRPDVLAAKPNLPSLPSFRPNDPLLWRQWALSQFSLNPYPMWDRPIDTAGVTVAVLDTGIDDQHEDLAGRVLRGLNTIDGSQNTLDTDGHGTHVAGIIGAKGNNGIGIAGVAWGVKLLAVKVLDSNGGNDAQALQGIAYAANAGAKVINLSFNSEATSVNELYVQAVNYARQRGAIVVSAAGNDAAAVTQPATTPGAIAVAALSTDGSLAAYSNRGAQIAIGAPGNDVVSTFPGNRYETDTGTSMAAPFVSGAAAVLWAEHPDWSVDQITKGLLSAVDPVFTGNSTSAVRWGKLDLSRLP